MTPSLTGRIQTRLVLLALVGSCWTVLFTPVLAAVQDVPTDLLYRAAWTALAWVAVLGVGWELVYHALQQLRWEKDWPTLFGLLTGAPEGLLVYLLLTRGLPWSVGDLDPATFAWSFGTTWVLIWATASTALRVVLPRWRFRGGRIW